MNLKELKNLPGARKAAMPDFVSPQLATLVDKPPSGDEWLHELKFDGYRLLCHLNGKEVRFWTRNQKDWTTKFAGLGKAAKALGAKGWTVTKRQGCRKVTVTVKNPIKRRSRVAAPPC